MRIIVIGLLIGGTVGFVTATTASRYVAAFPIAVTTQQSQVIPSDVPTWEI
jgi:hypothetical protein